MKRLPWLAAVALAATCVSPLSAAAVIAAVGPSPPPSVASGTTQPIPVSVTIVPACSSFSAGSLSFGSTSASVSIAGTATINVTCANGQIFNLTLDAGLNQPINGGGGGGCQAPCNILRYMSDGVGDVEAYSLFQDPGHQTGWGISPRALTGTGAPQPITVYGQTIAGGEPANTYSDTVNATLSF